MVDKSKKSGLTSLLKGMFRGFDERDSSDHSVSYETGAVSSSTAIPSSLMKGKDSEGKMAGGDPNGWLQEFVLPDDRFMRYDLYSEMAKSELVSACLQMHVAHALSPDMETGSIITIKAKEPEFQSMADELTADLGKLINDNVTSWAMLMSIYGVHYLRPYGKQGVGVTDVESSYFTLAKNIREYNRGDLLSGFTSEYLKQKEGGETRLAEPWALIPLKVPFWQPNALLEPNIQGGMPYSLYTDLHRRKPIETQDYGTSFLECAYPAWCELKESTQGLRGARFNASRQDRFIGVGMGSLDPVSAASYLNTVGTQMRKDIEAEGLLASKRGIIPTVMNRLIPIMDAGKGGLSIDQMSTSPDINGIEDTLFNLKRFCSAMGVDPSMIGWSDMMQGGLGQGGWAQTSIISALRANWIRIGVRKMVLRMIDIHIAFKHKKSFPKNSHPFDVCFHSLNTALATEKADENQSKVDYTTSVATLLDMIEQGGLSGSETFKLKMMSDVGISDGEAKAILKEIEAGKKAGEGEMYESILEGEAETLAQMVERLVGEQLTTILGGEEDEK